jgi:hypothetical protein
MNVVLTARDIGSVYVKSLTSTFGAWQSCGFFVAVLPFTFPPQPTTDCTETQFCSRRILGQKVFTPQI